MIDTITRHSQSLICASVTSVRSSPRVRARSVIGAMNSLVAARTASHAPGSTTEVITRLGGEKQRQLGVLAGQLDHPCQSLDQLGLEGGHRLEIAEDGVQVRPALGQEDREHDLVAAARNGAVDGCAGRSCLRGDVLECRLGDAEASEALRSAREDLARMGDSASDLSSPPVAGAVIGRQ